MADPKNKGMTAREAVERFCTYSDWAGTVSDDPEDTQRQEAERFPRRRREPVPRDAASELTKMLAHKVDFPDSPRARLRARENTPQPAGNDEIRALAVKVIRKAEKKGVLDRGVQSDRETAVFRAMKSLSRDADQFDGPAPRRLRATGRKVPVDPSKPREPIPTDMWEFLVLDIEGNRAAGEGLEYADLRFFDADPAQAVSEGAQDAVALALEMVSARGTDQLKPATPAVLLEPTAPKPSVVRPNRRGRKPGSGSYDSTDRPLVKEMHRLITSGEATGRYPAMLEVVDKAKGKAGVINRGKRLLRKYAKKYGPDEGLSD